MTAVTFLGSTAYVLDDAPEFGAGIDLAVELPKHVERGLTGIETRRPLGQTVRLGLSYEAVIEEDAVPAFRNGLQDLKNKRVLCPFWVYGFDAGVTSPTIVADYYVLTGDGAAPEVKAHGLLPFARPAYPMMVGRLKEAPDPELIEDDLQTVSISFVENDSFYLTFPAFAAPSSLADASGSARPIFPFRANWAKAMRSGSAEVDVRREEIGYGRAEAEAFFDQPAARMSSQGFTLEGNEPWQLVRFFLDIGLQNFWLPGGIGEALLTSNVAAIDTALTVDNPAGRGANSYVVLDDLVNRVGVKVLSTAGNNWNLAAAVGTAFLKERARVESLFLARFDKGLKLSFNGEVASVGLQFAEVPWETDVVGGETIGTTFGALPLCAYLYTFTIAFPGATQTWRFTGHERDLTDGNAYTAAQMEHGNIRETVTLERIETTVKSRNFAGHPLALFIPFRLEWPLMLEIVECDVSGSNATNKRVLFYGEVTRVKGRGPFLEATAKSMGPMMDRTVHKRMAAPHCPYVVFDDPDCTLVADDWKWQGTVVSYDATTRALTLSGVARVTGPAVTLTDNYFAGGFCYFGSGTAAQYRMISSNTVPGNVVLKISTPLAVAPGVGATVTMHPGCDGLYTTCVNKFANKANFGGFPFMPIGNPSLVRVSKNAGGSKK
jgi:uncharacterized phage protein (TIGR02218 family)